VSARLTLVALPGLEGSDLTLGPFKDAAPAGVDVRTVSYPSGPANSYEELRPLARSALPTDRAFFLLGWSFSGPMALMLAAEKPAGLRGVILAASFVRRPVPLPPWMRHLATPALFKLYPATYQAKALLGDGDARRLRHLVAEAHARSGPEALAARARAALTVDAREALAACEVPILYLRATRDRLIARRCSEEAQRLEPEMTIADIDGPHMALATNPEAAWRALVDFMRTTAGG